MPSFTLLLTLSLPLLILTPPTVAKDLPTDLTGFPPCAQTCISNNHGTCALLDMPCMCTNQVPIIFSCMQGSCDASDQATTLEFAQELCAEANATAATTTTIPSGSARTTLSTAIASSTATGSGSASGSGSESDPSAAKTSPPPRDAGAKHLSTGATAGIGIGAAVGAIALAGGVFLMWRRRRRRQASLDRPGASGKAGGIHGPVVRLEDADAGTPVYERKDMIHHEMDGIQWMELEAKEATQYIR